MYILLRHTKFGQYIFAVGSNKTVAALLGIKVDQVKIAAFGISGLMAGLGALLTNSKLMAIPTAICQGHFTYSIFNRT